MTVILLNRPLHPPAHAIDGEVLKALYPLCLKLCRIGLLCMLRCPTKGLASSSDKEDKR